LVSGNLGRHDLLQERVSSVPAQTEEPAAVPAVPRRSPTRFRTVSSLPLLGGRPVVRIRRGIGLPDICLANLLVFLPANRFSHRPADDSARWRFATGANLFSDLRVASSIWIQYGRHMISLYHLTISTSYLTMSDISSNHVCPRLHRCSPATIELQLSCCYAADFRDHFARGSRGRAGDRHRGRLPPKNRPAGPDADGLPGSHKCRNCLLSRGLGIHQNRFERTTPTKAGRSS